MKEMVKVYLYDNGHISIESINSNSTTQRMYFSNIKGSGMYYICEKGQEEYYLNKMVEERKQEIQNKIKELKKAEARMNEELYKIRRNNYGVTYDR